MDPQKNPVSSANSPMNDPPMPPDVKREAASSAPPASEPPSAKLIVQLFVVPLAFVALAVGTMFLIGLFAGAGSSPSLEQALDRLHNPGGERTADLLVGPGSKQRYMDAKTVADKIMKVGATADERVKIS